jgi:hypothetical protein
MLNLCQNGNTKSPYVGLRVFRHILCDVYRIGWSAAVRYIPARGIKVQRLAEKLGHKCG